MIFMDTPPTVLTVEDESGRRFILSGKSWEGGQGKVIVDSTGRFIVKLLFQNSTQERQRLRQQIRRVSLMDLSGIPVTQPLALLRPPHVGYVMEYLTGMKPIATLLEPPEDIIGDWVKIKSWYIGTGGLKYRLLILARLAGIMNKLHERVYAYGDLSPKNVFISASPEQSEVVLIDTDNLQQASSAANSFVRTAFYAAPEVITGTYGVTTHSDVFSFAILAFEMLALAHPFRGDDVVFGPSEMEIKAQEGKLPWVFHSTDHRNMSNQILPNDMVLSKGLAGLFQKTFEDGLLDRDKRPSMSVWEEKLYTALRFTLICPRCNGSYYKDRDLCPWCSEQAPGYLMSVVYDPEQQLGRKKRTGWCLQYPGRFVFTWRLFGYNDKHAEDELFEVEIDDRLGMRIHLLGSQECWIAHEDWKLENGVDNGKPKEKLTKAWRPITWNWRVHIGRLDVDHQVVCFERT